MKPPQSRAAAYLRVSTADQDLDNQRDAIAKLAAARGLELVETYEEHAPGAGAPRAQLERLQQDAHRGEFSTLIVWALDRLGRSMHEVLALVVELDRRGVRVLSVQESWLDTAGPLRPLLVAILGWSAEMERARIGERTRAGLERAKRRGVKLGRPRRAINLAHARSLRARGYSYRRTAKIMGVAPSTLHRALSEPLEDEGPDPAE